MVFSIRVGGGYLQGNLDDMLEEDFQPWHFNLRLYNEQAAQPLLHPNFLWQMYTLQATSNSSCNRKYSHNLARLNPCTHPYSPR